MRRMIDIVRWCAGTDVEYALPSRIRSGEVRLGVIGKKCGFHRYIWEILRRIVILSAG